MKITGIELLQIIKDKKIKENTKIKVYHLGIPTEHELLVTSINLIWEPGEFYVGELWDDDYSFEIIEEEQDKLIPKHLTNEFIQSLDGEIGAGDIKHIAHKVNEIINYLQHVQKKN